MRRAISWAAVLALASSPLSAGSIEVVITAPEAGVPVFGEVDFSAEVGGRERTVRVELFVDDRRVASLERPPYRVRVDVGDANRPRRFRAVAHGASGGTATAVAVTPKIEVDLEVDLWLQQLYVTVTRDGEAVLDLRREDFEIIDSGVEQRLVTFERGDVPLTMVLLIDASESVMGQHLAASLEAARGLLARLDSLDEAMVLVFSDRVLQISEFSRGETDLADLVDLEAGGGTALNDHLYAALRILEPRQGRPVVVLLSDGADTLSFLTMEQVLWKVWRTDAMIYRIQMTGDPIGDAALATVWRDRGANRQEADGLEQAIEQSGGRVRYVKRIEDLDATLASVLDELRQQYVLGYYPSSQRHDGSWNPVRVEVRAEGAVVRTRAGYIDR